MTTIAYRDGILAADTLLTIGNLRSGTIDKIGRTENGGLWGVSGSAQGIGSCQEWLKRRKGNPPKFDGCFILIEPDGSWREWWGDGWISPTDPQAAWGSGEAIARGAMFAGASAPVAVAAAIELDTLSGGDVVVLHLRNGKKRMGKETAR